MMNGITTFSASYSYKITWPQTEFWKQQNKLTNCEQLNMNMSISLVPLKIPNIELYQLYSRMSQLFNLKI